MHLIRNLPNCFSNHRYSKLIFRTALSLVVLFCGMSSSSLSQSLSGQWIGGFGSENEKGQRQTKYVLEIELSGEKISGYSYTYFSMGGRQFYVICKLKGEYDKGSKSMIINEVAKVKTNTPPDFENCLQSHRLTYLKQKNKETLSGKWTPFEKGSDCGSGLTELERIPLIKTNPTQTTAKKESPKSTSGSTGSSAKISPTVPPAASAPITKTVVEQPKEAPVPSTPPVQEKVVEKKAEPKATNPPPETRPQTYSGKSKDKPFKRTYQIIKTVEVSGPSFKVDIYDNGQVDGDTVSIFMNDRLLVPAKMLTAQPISITVKIDEDEDIYDLVMFAESLGSIPPNTALMIVTTPTNRYEINITSTDQTSGAVRFKVKR